jgi:FixJ family two-component response regulator
VNTSQPTVLIVDDDPLVLSSLRRLLRTTPYATKTFDSGHGFLDAGRPAGPACAIVDLHLPDIDGLELHNRLIERGIQLPLVFLTGYGSVDAAVGAMKFGAVDFLTKPVDVTKLLQSLERAISLDVAYQAISRRASEVARRVGLLTEREKEVMRFVVTGMLNKQIAGEMAISEKTIKVHRGRVMEKMGVKSVAELVRLSAIGGMPREPEILAELSVSVG